MIVLDGALRYRIDALDVTKELTPHEAGIVLPGSGITWGWTMVKRLPLTPP